MAAKCFRKGDKDLWGEVTLARWTASHPARPKDREATGSVAGIFSPCSQPEGPHLSLFHGHVCQKRSPRGRLCCPAGQVQTHSVYPAPGPPTLVWPISPSRAAFSSRSRGPGDPRSPWEQHLQCPKWLRRVSEPARGALDRCLGQMGSQSPTRLRLPPQGRCTQAGQTGHWAFLRAWKTRSSLPTTRPRPHDRQALLQRPEPHIWELGSDIEMRRLRPEWRVTSSEGTGPGSSVSPT